MLTASQESALMAFQKGANIFLTGKGGTGKSFLINHIIDLLKEEGKQVVVCAPTGVAATNIGGMTIHKLFGAKTTVLHPYKKCKDKHRLDIIRSADVLIIDEISMCRIDLFEYVANTILSLRKKPQLLFVGDFYQLPPVVRNDEKEVLDTLFNGGVYAFESPLWRVLGMEMFVLQEPMRQNDTAFLTALDNIREGVADFGCFRSYRPDNTAITICGTNQEADNINMRSVDNLVALGSKKHSYESEENGTVYATDYSVEKTLTLCEGARIIMLVNTDDYNNGSFGYVKRLEKDSVIVVIDGSNKEVAVPRHKWQMYDYAIEDTDGRQKLITKKRGTIRQFPMRLAWAISIHKSQGQTYDKVNVNVSRIFAEGQLYVALSRCRSLQGLNIVGGLSSYKCKTSPKVKAFMHQERGLFNGL